MLYCIYSSCAVSVYFVLSNPSMYWSIIFSWLMICSIFCGLMKSVFFSSIFASKSLSCLVWASMIFFISDSFYSAYYISILSSFVLSNSRFLASSTGKFISLHYISNSSFLINSLLFSSLSTYAYYLIVSPLSAPSTLTSLLLSSSISFLIWFAFSKS